MCLSSISSSNGNYSSCGSTGSGISISYNSDIIVLACSNISISCFVLPCPMFCKNSLFLPFAALPHPGFSFTEH